MSKWLLLIVCLTAWPRAHAIAQTDHDTTKQVEAWSPRAIPDELVGRINNGNLFVPNLRREPRVETPQGEADDDTNPDENAATPVVVEPENPDRRYRLVGISSETGQWLVFIENTESREVVRIAVGDEIASGSVTLIEYNRIEYTTDGQATSVLIGRDLTGEMPRAASNQNLDSPFVPGSTAARGSSDPGSSDSQGSDPSNSNPPSATPPNADAQRAEVLRRLRERRERESQ